MWLLPGNNVLVYRMYYMLNWTEKKTDNHHASHQCLIEIAKLLAYQLVIYWLSIFAFIIILQYLKYTYGSKWMLHTWESVFAASSENFKADLPLKAIYQGVLFLTNHKSLEFKWAVSHLVFFILSFIYLNICSRTASNRLLKKQHIVSLNPVFMFCLCGAAGKVHTFVKLLLAVYCIHNNLLVWSPLYCSWFCILVLHTNSSFIVESPFCLTRPTSFLSTLCGLYHTLYYVSYPY